jgi:membrane fusion protein (multidrug efflux system)
VNESLTIQACVLLACCACNAAGASPSGSAAHGGKPAAPKVHVQSVVVEERSVPRSLSVTGTLEADQRTELAANAAGRVVRTFVERGDHVKAGGLLAQLDTRGAEISRVEAEANARQIGEQLRAVRLECERYAVLRDKGAITVQEYDRQASQCATQASSEEAARARLADAARVLQDAAIRAPFAGVIGERFVSVGDYVQPSSKVVTLLDDDPLRLRISVPEPAIPFAAEGTQVTFRTLSGGDPPLTATIKYVGHEVRPTTRDMIVEAVVDNRAHALLPGTFVTVQLPTGASPQPIVPDSALVAAEGGSTLFVVQDGRLEQRAVRLGAKVEGGLAVLEGLHRGERVVLKPAADLQDGASVE